jgi:hypothetical protein
MSGQQPRYRTIWSRVQVGVLAVVVLACIVLLVTGAAGRSLDPVFAVAAIFFGLALIGHVTFLWLTARAERGSGTGGSPRR